eukprot:747884-Hanusia_phi.AAC.1
MSEASMRDLRREQVDLIKFALSSSFYPMIGLPDPENVRRKTEDAVFITRGAPQTSLHPTCVFSSCPSMIGSSDVLVYSQLLETNKIWLMNATRCPLVVVAMFCSNSVDCNASCTRLLVDNWLEIEIRKSEVAMKMLYMTQILRHCLANKLSSLLSSPSGRFRDESERVASDEFVHDEDMDLLPDKLRELVTELKGLKTISDQELRRQLATMMETNISCSFKVPSRSQVLWQLLYPTLRGLPQTPAMLRRCMEEAKSVVMRDGEIDVRSLQSKKG